MFPFKLDRPLAVLDIEATGISPRADRIVELAVIRLELDGAETSRTWLLNPTVPIPVETTAIHGITDETVKNCPTFAQVAREVLSFLGRSDLAGFNLMRYDIPMLCEEFARAGVAFDPDDRRVLDAQRIFHQKEPRDLSAALAFYCNRDHVDAHGAEADARATLDVLQGQFRKYSDLPHDLETLDRQFNARDPFSADRAGRLRWADGELVVNFGRKRGQKLRDLVQSEPSFLKWMVRSDFPMDTRQIVEGVLNGVYPQPPQVRANRVAAAAPEAE